MDDIIRTEIIDMNENGVGISKIDGCAVFIPGAVTGDICDIRIAAVKKNYRIGELVSVIAPSPHRCGVPGNDCTSTHGLCRSYEICGGCTMRHVNFDFENQCKRQTVINAFRRNGLRNIDVKDTLFALGNAYALENAFSLENAADGYRNKAVFHYSADISAGIFGYFSEKTNRVVNAVPCPLLPESFNEIVSYVNDYICCEKHEELCGIKFDSLYLRTNTKGELSAAFIIKDGIPKFKKADLVKELTKKFPQIKGILVKNPAQREYEAVFGQRELTDSLGGLQFVVSPEGFWQVNNSAAELMVNKVLEYAEKIDFKTCVDLYCGSGTFGLILAKAALSAGKRADFYGVELNPNSVRDAKRNAAINGIDNISFFCGDAADFREKISVHGGLAVIDPPRAGCSREMLENLLALEPSDIIYISCSPNTLSRDCAVLNKSGYKITEATPVNMFPRTKHVECVVLMSRV